MSLIKKAIKNGQGALSEFESKQVISRFGIPVIREMLVQDTAGAVSAARNVGFPVALKACSWKLMHKSDLGCIALGIETPDKIVSAFDTVSQKAAGPIDGILVQRMVSGSRELVAGMSRDPQFGVCVMLGFGGVMTEVIADTVFRVAPFDRTEAMDMIDELKSRPMLDAFRGQAPADLDALCRILTGLGDLGMAEEAIAEVDINPLIISRDGSIIAVDALVVLERRAL